MSWGDPAGYTALLIHLGSQRACPMGSGEGGLPHWTRGPPFPLLPAPLGIWLCSLAWDLREPVLWDLGGGFLLETCSTLSSTSSPTGHVAVLTHLGAQRAPYYGIWGEVSSLETESTVPSTSSPSSFSGERSTELKIPSFQQWALPSDHQHLSRSPAKVTSTEQKTVLHLRKPLGLEELRARNRGHFFCHFTLL